jgi:hypothetical protein
MTALQPESVMLSNFLKIFLFIATASTILGCGIKLGEENKDKEVAEVSGASCLTDSTESFKKFFQGESTEEEIGIAVDCFQKVLLTFRDNIRGQTKNTYSPEELSKFLTKSVLKGKTELSPAFVHQFYKFKAVLVGGSGDQLTKDELTALSSVVGLLKPEFLRLNPHMKILTGKWQVNAPANNEDKQKFSNAKSALGKTLDSIAGLLARGQRTYALEDLFGFVVEVLKLSSGSHEAEKLAKIEKLKPLLIEFKSVFIGPGLEIRSDEWSRIGLTVTELLSAKYRLDYFSRPLPDKDISGRLSVFQDIASDMTDGFVKLMHSKGDRAVTNIQIQNIIARLKETAPDLDIKPELVEQIGKIKLVLIGSVGRTYLAWTVNDFQSLHEKIPAIFDFARTAVTQLEYLRVNGTDFRKGLIKHEDFLKAETQLVGAVDAFSQQLLASYSLTDLKALVVALKPLLKDSVKLPANLDDLFVLVYSVKFALTGEAGPQLSVPNMQLIMKVGIRLYGHYVEFANFVQPFAMTEKQFTVNLEPVIGKLSRSLGLELQLKPSHQLTSEEIAAVVIGAQDANILDTKLKKESLVTLLDGVWSNVLNTPEKRMSEENPQPTLGGFNQEALMNLGLELKHWFDNQKAIMSIFENKAEYKKEDLVAEIKKRADETRDDNVRRAALNELYRVVSANGNMNFNSKGYLKILTPQNGVYRVVDVVNSNFAKTLARVFLRSYITDKERFANLIGITLAETEAGFNQFKNVIYDIGLLSPNNPNFISGRFLEANIFLSVSNGDADVSFEEFHHLILHIMSGLSRASALDKLAQSQCIKALNESPLLTEFDQDCLMNLYLNENDAFSDMPEFLKLKMPGGYTAEQNKKYYSSLLRAAGHVPNEQNTVLVKDASLFPHVVQYVEMVYDRHDANRDGYLGKDEATTAATTVFSDLIFSVVKKKFKKPEYPGILIYLLRCGSLPVTEASQIKLLGFIRVPSCKANQWSQIKSGRLDVGLLIEAMAGIKRATPPPPMTPADGEPVPPPVSAPAHPDDFICNNEVKWQCLDQFMYYMDQYCNGGTSSPGEDGTGPSGPPSCEPPPEEPEEPQPAAPVSP